MPQTVRAGILRPRALCKSVGALVSSKWPCWQDSLSLSYSLSSMDVSIERRHFLFRHILHLVESPMLFLCCVYVYVCVCVCRRPPLTTCCECSGGSPRMIITRFGTTSVLHKRRCPCQLALHIPVVTCQASQRSDHPWQRVLKTHLPFQATQKTPFYRRTCALISKD